VSDKTQNAALPARLRAAREQQGFTQQELSRLCGFGINQVNRFETGIREPSTTGLKTIANVLNVSMDYLAGLTENPHGQVIQTDLNVYEREIISTYREEGWSGIARLGVERLSK